MAEGQRTNFGKRWLAQAGVKCIKLENFSLHFKKGAFVP